MKSIFVAVVGSVGFTALAAAQAPVAVVEDVQGPVTGAEFMDYVAPGKVIKTAGDVVLTTTGAGNNIVIGSSGNNAAVLGAGQGEITAGGAVTINSAGSVSLGTAGGFAIV